MEKINLYQEMNDKIADLFLGCEDNGMCVYAGTYIKSLEDQLKSYKDLEEQGKLLKLPCAVGDKVYIVKNRELFKNYVVQIHISQIEAQTIFSCYDYSFCIDYIGKTVFLTRKEAEAALEIWR